MAKSTGKHTSKPATAELVPAEPETDLAFVQEAGSAVVAFLKGAAAFLTRANSLEDRAREVKALALTLKPSTNSTEDESVQAFIKRCNVGKKTIEGHWDGTDAEPGISRILHRLHRRVTNKRDIGGKLLDEAAAIGNKLHNDYLAKAERDAEEKRRREQAIEDERARKARADELAELERIALEKEAESDELSEREQGFVARVAVNYHPTVAAREVGYKNPEQKGAQLLTYSKIADAIQATREANALREQAAAKAQAPLEVATVEVEPDVIQAAGTQDRKTWRAKVTDEQAFIGAVFAGEHKIPRDVLCIDLVKLNQYARDLRTVINRWPGVEAVSSNKVV